MLKVLVVSAAIAVGCQRAAVGGHDVLGGRIGFDGIVLAVDARGHAVVVARAGAVLEPPGATPHSDPVSGPLLDERDACGLFSPSDIARYLGAFFEERHLVGACTWIGHQGRRVVAALGSEDLLGAMTAHARGACDDAGATIEVVGADTVAVAQQGTHSVVLVIDGRLRARAVDAFMAGQAARAAWMAYA